MKAVVSDEINGPVTPSPLDGGPVSRPADPARFQTTEWSLVLAYQEARSEPEQRRHLEALARTYMVPVRAYLVRRGCSAHDADDLAQKFFSEVVLGRDLIGRADREKGRLRSLLLNSLKNFLVDQSRRAAVRRPGVAVPGIDDLASRRNGTDPDLAFDREYAGACLHESLRRCEAHFAETRRPGHWRAFETRCLLPVFTGAARPPLKAIRDACDFASVAAAAAAIEVVRRRLRAIYRVVISETVANEADLEDELEHIDSMLRSTGRAGGPPA